MRKNFESEWSFPGYIVRQQLIDTRGWSPSLIDRFLKPDLVEVNPHNTMQRMRLYDLSTVYAVEKTPEFRNLFIEERWEGLTPTQRIAISSQNRIIRQNDKRFRRIENNSNAVRRMRCKNLTPIIASETRSLAEKLGIEL